MLARAYHLSDRPPAVLAALEAGRVGDWAAAQAGTKAVALRKSALADAAALTGDVMLGAGDPQAALAAYAQTARSGARGC